MHGRKSEKKMSNQINKKQLVFSVAIESPNLTQSEKTFNITGNIFLGKNIQTFHLSKIIRTPNDTHPQTHTHTNPNNKQNNNKNLDRCVNVGIDINYFICVILYILQSPSICMQRDRYKIYLYR